MRSEPSPLDKWISNNNTYINGKLKKSSTDFLPFKKATFTKINHYPFLILPVYMYKINQ
jgi:hypothetical protein